MRKFILILGLSALIFTSCLPQGVQIPQSPLLSTLERKSGLIAYIGLDGNVYVVDQGGGQLQSLTKDAKLPQSESEPFHLYQVPTWSSNGKQLAYVGLSGQGTQASSELFIADLEAETQSKIYSSANEAPFYLSWSPDDANLGFLSSMTAGGSMILQSVPAKGGERVVIDTGAPYYWSWAPDGHVIIAHAGDANTTSAERLAFLRVDSEITEDGLALFPASFQAPAWSPDGSRILLAAREESSENSIIVTDAAGKLEKTLGTFAGEAAFAWSKDGQKVAYIASEQVINTGLIGSLNVVDLTTSEEIVKDDKVFAFFWSPNSEKLAYFIPFRSSATPEAGEESSNQELLMQLNVLDIKTGENRELYSFAPTQEFLGVLAYFDQFHQSTTIWSPDNNNLVLSFLDGKGQPSIAIVAASGQMQPRLLAQGYVAFWSWE